jgi:hypothetical protein
MKCVWDWIGFLGERLETLRAHQLWTESVSAIICNAGGVPMRNDVFTRQCDAAAL